MDKFVEVQTWQSEKYGDTQPIWLPATIKLDLITTLVPKKGAEDAWLPNEDYFKLTGNNDTELIVSRVSGAWLQELLQTNSAPDIKASSLSLERLEKAAIQELCIQYNKNYSNNNDDGQTLNYEEMPLLMRLYSSTIEKIILKNKRTISPEKIKIVREGGEQKLKQSNAALFESFIKVLLAKTDEKKQQQEQLLERLVNEILGRGSI